MPVERLVFDLDDVIRTYEAGESLDEIARKIGVSRGTIRRRLRDAGYQPRTIGESTALRYRNKLPDLSPFFRRYEAGEGLVALAREAQIHTSRFARLLDEAGIPRRTIGEAVGLRYTRMSKAERVALTQAAHDATRGRPANPRGLERRARTMQATLQLASVADTILAVWIAQRGLTNFTLQKAVGRYNVDIAVHEPLIAVEVNGRFHLPIMRRASRNGSTAAERRHYLFNRGWRLIEVAIHDKILRPASADRVIALIEEAGADEPSWGQHCVIRGDGEFFTRSETESYNRA